MCMQRASDALAPKLGTVSIIDSVQQEHRMLEQYLPDPDCDVAISEFIREKKLDFLLRERMGATLESRISELINPHCVQYLLANLDTYQMQLVLAQMDSFMNQLNRRIELSSSELPPEYIVNLSKDIARDYLQDTVLAGK